MDINRPADLLVTDLAAGNDPILAFAADLMLADPTAESVTFTVSYVEGDQQRNGEPSEPDTLTVNRAGEISA